ncbi:MAG: AMP-binding protein [Treponema sp.]|nr:AMP-binding protein [Treponema sp.]
MGVKKRIPWAGIESYRGKVFTGEWPTFPELIEISVDRFGERPCFTDFEGPGESKNTITYNQMYQKVQQLAKWMVASGIKKGDRIAVTGKNSPEWAVTYLATFFAGGIVIPIDNGLHEAEAGNLIKTSSPKIIFSDDEKKGYFRNTFAEIPVYSLQPKETENYVYNLKFDGEVEMNEPVKEDDTAAILFTSGTTGIPKGVMLSHKNLISDCFIAQTNLDIYHTDVFYALLPIHHGYTMQAAFICPLSVGAEIVFGKSMAVTRLMKELREGKITIMLGVPLLYNKLMAGITKGIESKGPFVAGIINALGGISYFCKKAFHFNPGKKLFKAVLMQANIYTLRVAICGGGPLSSDVFKKYNEMGIDFIQGYGLTETAPIITLNPVEHFKIESVGRDFSPYEEMKIIDIEKYSTPGERPIGEIVVKGPMVMQGYYNMPEETAKMFTEDGFFKTGDLGWMDSEHYVMLCGRAKNLIVTGGGKNVYPEEIEDAFQMFSNIQQIVVQGYDTERGEEIEALIYPADSVFEALGMKRESAWNSKEVSELIKADVASVNKNLQPYARITRTTILENPLAQTTTMKVKRNYKK